MLLGQTDGNSWKGRTIHITSLLYNTKHVRSPNWPGNHRIHTADKKRAIPRNKMTLWFHLLIIMFVLKEHYITIILLSINHRHTDPRMFYIFLCVFFSLSLSLIYIFILYILLFYRKCNLIRGHVIISFTISCPSPLILVIRYLNLKNNIFKSVI